jgi:predicted phage terminase large subunit-like protein
MLQSYTGSLRTRPFDFSKPSHTRANKAAALDFDAWLPAVTPSFNWRWPHLVHIQRQLQRVTDGEIDRLMLFLPPRHGKSEMTTVRYPVWRLKRSPTMRVIVGAYNQTLANKFSRKARKIAAGELLPSRERAAAEDWETEQGGGLRAVGVGGGITGQGGDLIIIDDPVKNREEANSQTYRDKVWDWYTDDLYTRLEPGASIILIMTRWHQDDLAGRILVSEDAPSWTVVNLPALAEEGDPLGRPVGAALCPDRYDESKLASILTVLGSWSFAALYQQRPAPAEGGMFKRHWFEIVDAVPADCSWVRWWDKAGTSKDGDWSAGVLIGNDGRGKYYVADVQRDQWSIDERNRIMLQTAALDHDRTGGNLVIWSEQEPGSSGKESAEATTKLLAGYAVYSETSTGSKEVRAQPLAAQCEAGNVKLLRGAWNAAYLDEMTSFPFGANDDQVDASSGAFNKVASPPWLLW